jgi:hypothetical protein
VSASFLSGVGGQVVLTAVFVALATLAYYQSRACCHIAIAGVPGDAQPAAPGDAPVRTVLPTGCDVHVRGLRPAGWRRIRKERSHFVTVTTATP